MALRLCDPPGSESLGLIPNPEAITFDYQIGVDNFGEGK
jgi:hypothetical protein